MSNEQGNFKKSMKKSMGNNRKEKPGINESLNNYENLHNEPEFDENYKEDYVVEEEKREIDDKGNRNQGEKPLKIFGTLCIVATIISFIVSGTAKVDTSQSAKNALENKISTVVSAGTVLLSKDEEVQAKDHTITHKSDMKDTKIWVWDYAAEDGDYVQVIVDGSPIADEFMIKNKPKEFTVPAVSSVEIKGVKDGGGGITYAVRYDVNGTSYFNGTPEGETNIYTLINE